MKLYLRIYLALLGFLALTLVTAFFNLGSLNLPVALLIAIAKASLVVYYFMELKTHPGMQRIAALAGIFWLGILFTLVSTDYMSRDWMRLPAPWPKQLESRIPFDN